MSKYRQAARVDDNQKAIVKALLKIPGVSVALNHDDVLVGYKFQNYWFEIKNPDTLKKDGEYKKGAVKKGQKDLDKTWCGQYDIVHCLDQILLIMGIGINGNHNRVGIVK